MKNLILTAALAATLASSAFPESYRVTYTDRGLIQRITVQAESFQEARNTAKAIFPAATITGAHRVR